MHCRYRQMPISPACSCPLESAGLLCSQPSAWRRSPYALEKKTRQHPCLGLLEPAVPRPENAQFFRYMGSRQESESEVAQSCPTLCDPMDCYGQAPPSMGFSRQEYWSGLPFLSPEDLPNTGIKPGSPALEADALTSEPPGKPVIPWQ